MTIVLILFIVVCLTIIWATLSLAMVEKVHRKSVEYIDSLDCSDRTTDEEMNRWEEECHHLNDLMGWAGKPWKWHYLWTYQPRPWRVE